MIGYEGRKKEGKWMTRWTEGSKHDGIRHELINIHREDSYIIDMITINECTTIPTH
jgi:hypothetical protein